MQLPGGEYSKQNSLVGASQEYTSEGKMTGGPKHSEQRGKQGREGHRGNVMGSGGWQVM